MRKWMIPISVFAIAAVAFVGYTIAGGDKHDKGSKSHVAIGQPAPQFSLQDQTGKAVSLADHSGKIVVLEWFNNECPYVVRHYKANTMLDTSKKYADKDVVWLAINSTSGKSNDDNKTAAGDWHIAYPVLNDADGRVGKMYGARTTPHMFIIDKTGKIAYMGAIDNDQRGNASDKINYVDKALAELVAGNSVSEPETRPYGCSVKYGS